jgi:UDP-N-acetylglucosamine--N-acetylmuramyl-(pentapeptide) pyrophosphoryl-undecaprenol N-acetylglucosamine transferase
MLQAISQVVSSVMTGADGEPTKGATIAFQPPNHVGLGHVSRLVAIALAIRSLEPRIKLPFIIDGDPHGLVEAEGFPCLRLPSLDAVENGRAWDGWEASERRAIIVKTAVAMVHALRPSLIVFDCFPHSAVQEVVLRELVPAAIVIRKMKQPQMRQQFKALQAYRSRIQAILVPHADGEIDIPNDLRSCTTFTGPIVRSVSSSSGRLRPTPGHRWVVICGGGGGYPGTVGFYNLALAAVACLRARGVSIEAVLVAGPLFKDWWDLDLVSPVRVLPFDPQLSATLSEADLVLCQGGYNTIAEIRALGVPAICVPADRASDDQFERAREAASGNMQVYCGTDAHALAELMLTGLQQRHQMPVVDTSGARIAAEVLINLITHGTGTHRRNCD